MHNSAQTLFYCSNKEFILPKNAYKKVVFICEFLLAQSALSTLRKPGQLKDNELFTSEIFKRKISKSQHVQFPFKRRVKKHLLMCKMFWPLLSRVFRSCFLLCELSYIELKTLSRRVAKYLMSLILPFPERNANDFFFSLEIEV